ncbi:MAG: hypothetical protein AB7J28_05255 [Hyphomonadaceae bacterium]
MRPAAPPPIGLTNPTQTQTPSAPQPQAANANEPVAPMSPQPMLLAPDLVVEIDAASSRFVSKLLDPETEEALRQYPKQVELAFSAAIRAYMNTRNSG